MARSLGLRSALIEAVFLGAVGCGSSALAFETADPRDEVPPRRPPAVSVEPATRLPDPAMTADARATLAVLSSPHELALVREVIARFFRALVDEVPADLDGLLTEQAWLDAPAGRTPARAAFRARFAQLDFSPLRGVMLYREPELEIYRGSEARALAYVRAVPVDLGADEVFVRVHLGVSHAGKVRLFPDEVALILRSERTGLRIRSIGENTPVP